MIAREKDRGEDLERRWVQTLLRTLSPSKGVGCDSKHWKTILGGRILGSSRTRWSGFCFKQAERELFLFYN